MDAEEAASNEAGAVGQEEADKKRWKALDVYEQRCLHADYKPPLFKKQAVRQHLEELHSSSYASSTNLSRLQGRRFKVICKDKSLQECQSIQSKIASCAKHVKFRHTYDKVFFSTKSPTRLGALSALLPNYKIHMHLASKPDPSKTPIPTFLSHTVLDEESSGEVNFGSPLASHEKEKRIHAMNQLVDDKNQLVSDKSALLDKVTALVNANAELTRINAELVHENAQILSRTSQEISILQARVHALESTRASPKKNPDASPLPPSPNPPSVMNVFIGLSQHASPSPPSSTQSQAARKLIHKHIQKPKKTTQKKKKKTTPTTTLRNQEIDTSETEESRRAREVLRDSLVGFTNVLSTRSFTKKIGGILG